jgi:hypothetical protein|tara:strand:- start:476 stop:625 length:150 start_codon:yes stop_codon:yes gene_type:complete
MRRRASGRGRDVVIIIRVFKVKVAEIEARVCWDTTRTDAQGEGTPLASR